jgi:orotate phosphoribosyltransferase
MKQFDHGADPRVATLFELLMQYSFQKGDFTLSSGKKSTYYMDGRMTTLSAQGAQLIGEILYDWISPLNVQAIGGMTLGADPIVTAISLTSALRGSPIPAFLIRKESKGHGTGRQIEGHLKPGNRVVLVEDVVTTGGSFLKAIDAVKNVSADIEIVQLMALVDRKEGCTEALSSLQIPFQAIFPIDAFLQAQTSASLNPSC